MSAIDKNTVGWCAYCKNEIYEGDDYVVRNKNKYHPDCYDLIESDTYGKDIADYTETDFGEQE